MDKKLHVMVFGAHCFDAEVIAGGVIAKYTRHGHKATIVHMTRGERGSATKSPEVYGKQLEEELQASAKVLGADGRWMGYMAGQIPASDKIMLDLCDLIRELKPDIVITHWRGSVHPRHNSTHENVVGGVQLAGADSVVRALPPHKVRGLFFGENCEDLEGFKPTLYVNISETFDTWFEALSKYEIWRRESERDHTGTVIKIWPYEDYYRTMSIIRAKEIGNFEYAQAFMAARRDCDYLPLEE